MPLERLTQDLIVEIAKEFPTLSNLNLSRNSIREIDCDLSVLPYVGRLNLNYNQLQTLPLNLHKQLPQLTQLLLSHNSFTSLESLRPLKSLTVLDLSSNAIGHIDQLDHLKFLPLLGELSLQGNQKLDQMDNYREQVIARLPHLISLDQRPIVESERERARKLTPAPQPRVEPSPPIPCPIELPVFDPQPPPPPKQVVKTLEVPATTPAPSSQQLELMQHRVNALQELLLLQEAELTKNVAAASSNASAQSTYHRLLTKWRTKVYELLVHSQQNEIASNLRYTEAIASAQQLKIQVEEGLRREHSLNQRLADTDAAHKLLQLQIDQLQNEKSTLQNKFQRQINGLETERQHTRRMAHQLITFVQDDDMVQKMQQMYAKIHQQELRLQKQVQNAELLAVSLARKEARLRNQEAALEGERRVWIKRLQANDTSLTSPKITPKSNMKTVKLKPETEQILREAFQRLDPYQTGLVATEKFLLVLEKDWVIKQALGVPGHKKLISFVRQNKLFSTTKHITWGEFVLIFLPDLSQEENQPFPCDENGVPLSFDAAEKPSQQHKRPSTIRVYEWSREMLEEHVLRLEAERTQLIARLKEDARDLMNRVQHVHLQWQLKCESQVQSLAQLQNTVREQELELSLQSNAKSHFQNEMEKLRASTAKMESDYEAQISHLKNQMEANARAHDKQILALEENHADQTKELEVKLRQTQKDFAKQEVYIRQIERQLKRVQDSAAEDEIKHQNALSRQLEKRENEIAKLRRERNALLTTLREQESAVKPSMTDVGVNTDFVTTNELPTPKIVKAPSKNIPVKQSSAPVPQTVPHKLSSRLSALSSEANRWLMEDEWGDDEKQS